jgi:hypothetical protein
MAVQGLKGLLALNGGGAVALLAFIRLVWTAAPKLVPWITVAMIPLLLGAAVAVGVHFVRFNAALASPKPVRHLHRTHMAVVGLSFILFLLGMAIVTAGVLLNLPDH